MIGVSLVIGAFAGASGMGQWRNFLLWRNSVPFDQKDAYFNRDIGFYVFELPWLHYLVDFAMAAAVVALIAGAVVHYLYGGLRLQASRDRLSGAAQVQLSVLLGFFVLAKGADYYLDRFDLVNDDNRLFTGMNYTAENAVLPAKNILLVVAVICAVLFFLNIWRRTWQLPGRGPRPAGPVVDPARHDLAGDRPAVPGQAVGGRPARTATSPPTLMRPVRRTTSPTSRPRSTPARRSRRTSTARCSPSSRLCR